MICKSNTRNSMPRSVIDGLMETIKEVWGIYLKIQHLKLEKPIFRNYREFWPCYFSVPEGLTHDIQVLEELNISNK